MDVFLADDTLWVEVRDRSKARGGVEVVETIPIEGVALRTRTWYFLDVQVCGFGCACVMVMGGG